MLWNNTGSAFSISTTVGTELYLSSLTVTVAFRRSSFTHNGEAEKKRKWNVLKHKKWCPEIRLAFQISNSETVSGKLHFLGRCGTCSPCSSAGVLWLVSVLRNSAHEDFVTEKKKNTPWFERLIFFSQIRFCIFSSTYIQKPEAVLPAFCTCAWPK